MAENGATAAKGWTPEDIQRQYMLAALVLFIISLAAGLMGESGDNTMFYLWLGCGILAFVALRQAFPDMFNYAIWLFLVYVCGAAGVLFMFGFGIFTGAAYIVGGLLLEAAGIAAAAFIVLRIKRTRDEVFGDVRGAPSSLPLGIWSASVLGFWAMVQASTLLWASWAQGGGESGGLLYAYAACELAAILSMFYILWLPQAAFRRGEMPQMAEMFYSPAAPSGRDVRTPSNACAVCSGPLTRRKRACPSCGRDEDFLWCRRCETYMVACPKCLKKTPYGRSSCVVCAKGLGRNLTCPCGKSSPLSDWGRPK